MPTKRDIKYEIRPDKADIGEKWVDVHIENIGSKELRGLNVRLNSLDTLGLNVLETSRYIPILAEGESTTLYFRVDAYLTTGVYVTMDGYKGNMRFYWESPTHFIKVGEEPAELMHVYTTTKPRFVIGDKIKCEATVKANTDAEDLTVEFWAEAPDGTIDEIKTVKIDEMEDNKSKIFETEIEPDQEGLYTIDTYLYDGVRRLGHNTDYVVVEA